MCLTCYLVQATFAECGPPLAYSLYSVDAYRVIDPPPAIVFSVSLWGIWTFFCCLSQRIAAANQAIKKKHKIKEAMEKMRATNNFHSIDALL